MNPTQNMFSPSLSLHHKNAHFLPVSLISRTLPSLFTPWQVNMPWGTWCTVCPEAATTTTAAEREEAEATPAAWWGRPCRTTPSQQSAARCTRSSPRTWRTPRPWGTPVASRSSSASPAARETSKQNGKMQSGGNGVGTKKLRLRARAPGLLVQLLYLADISRKGNTNWKFQYQTEQFYFGFFLQSVRRNKTHSLSWPMKILKQQKHRFWFEIKTQYWHINR